jgi:hypothetical protein
MLDHFTDVCGSLWGGACEPPYGTELARNYVFVCRHLADVTSHSLSSYKSSPPNISSVQLLLPRCPGHRDYGLLAQAAMLPRYVFLGSLL